MFSFQSILTAVGMWPARAALTLEPSYSSLKRASMMIAFFFFIANFIREKSARILGSGLLLKFECTNGWVLVSVLNPSDFHLLSPPSSIATLWSEKYNKSHTPLASDMPE